MPLDPLLFVIVILIIYWILDDVVGQFLFCSFLIGVYFYTSDFVTVPPGLGTLYELIIAVVALASVGKFLYLINKKKPNTNVVYGD